VLFKLHWHGKGVKGEAWQKLLREDFRPRLQRMWEQANGRADGPAWLYPRALLGFFPCYALGNRIIVLDPSDRASELTRFTCPRQPKGDRICLADFFLPAADGGPPEVLDVIALQAVTAGSQVTELMARLEAEDKFTEQLFVHGLGAQTAEGLAEWLHYEVRRMLDIPLTQGRRYSWGYPAVPEQSEHVNVDAVLDLSRIGMSITDGYAPDPEQSTLALVAHHPQAIYFGTRQGRLLENGSPDDVIRGSHRDPSLFGDLDDSDPADGVVEEEDARALAG
jgi:5-methyltetrahydrofolate--homocysteine methyltransferase